MLVVTQRRFFGSLMINPFDFSIHTLTKVGFCSLLVLPLLCSCSNHGEPESSYRVAAKGLHAAALSEQGEMFVVGSIHHGGSLWRHSTQERLFNWNHQQGAYSTLSAFDFSTRANWAISAENQTLVLWNASTGEGERFFTAPGEVLDLELGPNGNTALLGLSDHTAVLFNIRQGGILRTFTHQNRVRSVDMSANGELALTGSEDFTAALWDVNSGEKIVELKHDDDVQLVKLSRDGNLALSVSKYDKALLWETRSGQALGELPLQAEHIKRGIRFTSARFNADNRLLLTGRPDQIVELWDTATLSRLASWKIPKDDPWKPTGAAIIALAFKSDTDFVAIASNGFIHDLKYK